MSVSLYFGLPGCGKTTTLASLAVTAIRKSSYTYVYSNVDLAIPGVIVIDNSCIGTYCLRDCLVLIDEATLFADSRDYKNFTFNKIQYFLEHRHYNADIVLFTQQWDGVDLGIRVITKQVYYVYKGFLTGKWISKVVRIPYGIIFPDPKRSDQALGEIVQGYRKPSIFLRFFAKVIYRPIYYKYFDSWDAPELPDLPSKYMPVPGHLIKPTPFKDFLKHKWSKQRKNRLTLLDRVQKSIYG